MNAAAQKRIAEAHRALDQLRAEVGAQKQFIRDTEALLVESRRVLDDLTRQRADAEDALYRAGDPAGIYGQYPPAPLDGSAGVL